MTFTNEQMAKAKQAKSAEELLEMAKESGIELTAEQAAKYFAELHKQGELSDDELASVAGGDKDGPDRSDVNGFPSRRSTEPGCGAIEMPCGECQFFKSYPVNYKDFDGICLANVWS